MDFAATVAIILLVLITLWWVLRPLWQPHNADNLPIPPHANQRLAELTYRRDAIYTTIKELDLDLAMNKVSQLDYEQRLNQLKTDAARILKQIDQVTQTTDRALEQQVDALLAEFDLDQTLQTQVRQEIQQNLQTNQRNQCPNCYSPIQSGDAFCSQCGTSLSQACSTCGAAIKPDDRFCTQCGTQLMAEAAQ